jgi:hypothetical protein
VSLLIVYLVTLVIGQAISVGIGLAIERWHSPHVGLMVFIACYFCVFWLAWRVSVRLTAPRT